ncbi:MAG: restriction endonuclease [Ktedonobacterales bacterium]|nr:restriction endonuclease [Ktedonobacterales bacterium]
MARHTRPRAAQTTRLTLTEYTPLLLPKTALTLAQGERLWRDFSAQVRVAFPSPQTGDQWQLTAQGWVGILPLAPDLTLDLLPRVPLDQLFTMLEVAWDLASFRFAAELTTTADAVGFYERLVLLLARRTIALARTGLYQRYEAQAGTPPTVRGRLDVVALSRRPWVADLPCTFHERTADSPENRALLWTLHTALHEGHCTARTLPTVRAAYRALAHSVTLTPTTAEDLATITYHRLNGAYRPLHALCRFILRHTGPAVGDGPAPTLPFLVNMPRLFERFVVAWLAGHLPAAVGVRAQVRIPLDGDGLAFVADGVLSDRVTGQSLAVFDTKYTATPDPVTDDIAQVVAYARALGCQNAWLIYPLPPDRPLDIQVGETRVRSIGFALAGDLDATGAAVMRELLDHS